MADALVACNRTEDALALLRTAPRGVANCFVFSTVMKGFAHAGLAQKCWEVYVEMKRSGVMGSLVTYNTLMDACARGGQMVRLNDVLTEISNAGLKPDAVTYATALKGLCSEALIMEALTLLQRMRSNGMHTTDEVIFNKLITACTSNRGAEDALRLLAEMEAHGACPSNYTLSALIKVLGRGQRIDEARHLVLSLPKKHSFKVNLQVYTCLISACCFSRRIRLALELHDQMVLQGIVPDSKLYTVLARGCLKTRDLEAAAEILSCAYGFGGLVRLASQPGPVVGLEGSVLSEVTQALEGHGIGLELISLLRDNGAIASQRCPQVGTSVNSHSRASRPLPRNRRV